MTFEGVVALADPPKRDASASIAALHRLGVTVKMITGDSRRVAAHVAIAVGLDGDQIHVGADLADLDDEALIALVANASVFAEVDPIQKERIIAAHRRAGEVVGHLGDGINDAPALHAANVGISVDTAVDVAKEAADFVLLEQDLGVLAAGIEAGRITFANTMKYVFAATSANFGNMFSMAGASLS
jgi:Mg2+-importing ATPase